MLVLQINSKIDCAGVSWNLCNALNKHTNIDCRHIIGEEHIFEYPYDIGPRNFDQDEFDLLIKEADILHFNHIDYFTSSFGHDWTMFLKKKIIVYHSHAGWEEGKEYHGLFKVGGLYQRYMDAQAVLVCNPNNVGIFEGAKWIPNILPENGIESKRDFDGILKVAHCPSHHKYKNVSEMMDLMREINGVEYNLIKVPERNRFLQLMSRNHLLFDNIWQGYSGLVSLEAMQMGVIPIARLTDVAYKGYCETLNADNFPIALVSHMIDVKRKILEFDKNRILLEQKSKEMKEWVKTYYNEKRIVKMWEEFYNGLV